MNELRSDLALDATAVLDLAASEVEQAYGWRPTECRLDVIKQNAKRVVARYEFRDAGQVVPVAGKWYRTDRGALVAKKLRALHGVVSVPEVIGYFPDVHALFAAWIEGPLLRDVAGGPDGPAAARGAGMWLAGFHASGLPSPRHCGPEKQRGSVERWAHDEPQLRPLAERLDTALAGQPDPRLPVHYDFYHQQVIVPDGAAPAVIDLDEAGRGDPAFDTEHFLAHLELLACDRHGDPHALVADAAAFRAGYASVAGRYPESPVLGAVAWCKLAYQALHRGAPAAVQRYALDAVGRMLAAA